MDIDQDRPRAGKLPRRRPVDERRDLAAVEAGILDQRRLGEGPRVEPAGLARGPANGELSCSWSSTIPRIGVGRRVGPCCSVNPISCDSDGTSGPRPLPWASQVAAENRSRPARPRSTHPDPARRPSSLATQAIRVPSSLRSNSSTSHEMLSVSVSMCPEARS